MVVLLLYAKGLFRGDNNKRLGSQVANAKAALKLSAYVSTNTSFHGGYDP